MFLICILVFQQKKAKEHRNKVLIVDASKEFKTSRAQNELLSEHVERIYKWVRNYSDVDGIARVVALQEIAANDYNLNIPLYVEPKSNKKTITLEKSMEQLKASGAIAFSAENKLVELFKKEGLLR